MHADDLAKWQHDHVFDSGNAAGERGTRVVMWISVRVEACPSSKNGCGAWMTHESTNFADGCVSDCIGTLM
jgi:hypothetical protein